MKKATKKLINNNIFKTIVGIIIASVFLYITLKGQPLDKIVGIVSTAKPQFLFIAFIFYVLSFVARSEKWRIQIKNMNYKLQAKTAFYAIIIHYFVNSFTTKLGVVGRCVNLKRNANINMSPCFASFVSENIFDHIFLVIGLIIVGSIQYSTFYSLLSNFIVDWQQSQSTYSIWILAALIIIAIILYFLIKNNIILLKFKVKIKIFVNAVKKSFKIKKIGIFILWNIVLWILLFFMNYFLFASLFDSNTSLILIYTITIFTYFAWLIPSPGGIGTVEYFILQAFVLFNLPNTSAIAFGLLSNGFTLISIILLGVFFSFIQKLFKPFLQDNSHAN